MCARHSYAQALDSGGQTVGAFTGLILAAIANLRMSMEYKNAGTTD